MMTFFDVMEFHRVFQRHIGDPRKPDVRIHVEHRIALIDEELDELKLALQGLRSDGTSFTSKIEQVAAVADALGDLQYVIAGSAITWGIDLPAIHAEIHTSNMTKTITPGILKIQKGPDFVEPDLIGVVENSIHEFSSREDLIGEGEDCYWPTPTEGQ